MESRQLGPVYDALEIGDMRKAVSECDKVLRKNPNHFGAQSLKAFALARQGEQGEALTLAQHVLKITNALMNPHVQQGLALAFQVLRKPQEEMAVYKGALKYAVGNQKTKETLCKIFFVAARNGMYKEQHATAVDLNKRFKQGKYLWWVIVSLVLESQQKSVDNSSSSKQLQLTLAGRMVEKALAEGQVDSTEELRICLDVLRLQGKQTEMTNLLSIDEEGNGSSLAQKIANDPDLITERLGLLVAEGSLDEAIAQCVKTLDARDNWADYKHYIEAVSKEQTAENSDSGQVVQSLCQNLDKWAEKHGRARGATLAFVELANRVGTVRGMNLGAWIWKYVDEFRSKAISFLDIRAYLVAHVQNSAEAISYHNTQLEQRLESARQEDMSVVNNSVAWLNLEKIRYLLQALADVTDPHSWANGIDRLLKFGLDSNQPTKRSVVCSDMVLLAGQRIIQTAFLAYGQKEDGNSSSRLCSALFIALCVFESGIKLNGDHFILKLYAIRLYLYLSCYDRARQLYDTLSIKNIQHDTLDYLVVGQGIALGCFSRDLELCYEAVSFYDRAKIKVARELESSYRNGTYSNISDFIEFEDNLARSAQHECTHRNALRGETMEQAGTKGLLEQWKLADVVSIQHSKESLAELHDNRDTQVMGQLVPAEMTKWDLERLTRPASAIPIFDWIQLYSLVPQIMHFIASADLEVLKTKADELSLTASDVVGSFDQLFARGIGHIIELYTEAVAGNKQSAEEALSKLTNLVRQALSGAEDLDNAVCHTMALNTIRKAAMASELFTYALSVKQALVDQKSPSANTVAAELSRLRKHALKVVGGLRKWADKEARGVIQSQWPIQNDSECALAPVAEYVADSRHGSVIEMVAKNCAAGWLKSAKSLIVHWEQCS